MFSRCLRRRRARDGRRGVGRRHPLLRHRAALRARPRRSGGSAARCGPGRATSTCCRPRSVACCDPAGCRATRRPSSPTSVTSSPSSTSRATASAVARGEPGAPRHRPHRRRARARSRRPRGRRARARVPDPRSSCATRASCARSVRDEPDRDARAVRRAGRPRLRAARRPLLAARSQRCRAAGAVRGARRRRDPRRGVQHRACSIDPDAHPTYDYAAAPGAVLERARRLRGGVRRARDRARRGCAAVRDAAPGGDDGARRRAGPPPRSTSTSATPRHRSTTTSSPSWTRSNDHPRPLTSCGRAFRRQNRPSGKLGPGMRRDAWRLHPI